ncbi:MAG: sugar phosphate isomerase/epimerase family protein [Thermodesulfobacteriota bacterium]|nr:sugar phosphate isomerase/epimerase family protein [Thermodesulfobacteriota bacterium]
MKNTGTNVRPKLAMCNLFLDVKRLREFALDHGFSGIDWSFEPSTLPQTPAEESMWVKYLSSLKPLELRYHCPFQRIDLGHVDPREAKAAEEIFRNIIRLVARANGEFLTIHIGLGRDSTQPLSWDRTSKNLSRVVQYGASHGVRVCLENLAWGWTSRPHLFEKLIRRGGASVTFDIGHAHACEAINTQEFEIEDFLTPHADRVLNAHIYHTELPNRGHIPPERLEDIKDRLEMLQRIGCNWWVLEVWDENGLLQTKKIVEEYLTQAPYWAKSDHQDPSANMASHG